MPKSICSMQMYWLGSPECTAFFVSTFVNVLLHVWFCLNAENVNFVCVYVCVCVCMCLCLCQQVAGSIHQCLEMTSRGKWCLAQGVSF